VSDTASRTDRLKAAHDRLQEAVESIVTGEDWARMLKVASKFHRYSFQNQILIFSQRPDATLVAGFRRWQELDRFVRKGEKGIAIFAPMGGKCRSCEGDGGKDFDGEFLTCSRCMGRGRYQRFKIAYVFDVTQTEGEPLEDLDAVRPKLLSGDAPEGIWDALVAQAKLAGFEVVRDQRGSENGYCDFSSARIGIRPDIEPLQAVKTLVHELAHALLHANEASVDRSRQEVEVESVAFMVLDALGLDTGDYSFSYIARWASGDVEKVKDTGTRVAECAKQIFQSLEASPTSNAGSISPVSP
jgi:antirestriction protein ArdC